MSTIANPIASATTPGTQTNSNTAAAPPDSLGNESTFLTLLVSQLQNQDPLDPVDSNQFVTQLTQFSQLEQLIGIHSDTTSISQATDPTQAGSQTTPNSATTPAPGDTNQTNTNGVN